MTQIATDSEWRIYQREGAPSDVYWQGWLQFIAVSHQCAVVIDCDRAVIAGWLMRRATYQGMDAWGGMTADEIIAWRQDSDARHGVKLVEVTVPATVARAREIAAEAAQAAADAGRVDDGNFSYEPKKRSA